MAGIPSPTGNPVIEGVRCASNRIFSFDEVSIIRGNDIFFHFMIIKVLKKQEWPTSWGDESKCFFRKFLALLVLSSFLRGTLLIFPSPLALRISFLAPCLAGNNSFKLVSQDKLISYTTIREAFRKDLRSAGVDSSTFGFCSLRSRGHFRCL